MSKIETIIEDLDQIKTTLHDLENLDNISISEFIEIISNHTQDKGIYIYSPIADTR